MKKPGIQVLVAEQGTEVLKGLKEALHGFQLLTANNGFDAIRLAQKHAPKLIIIDSDLPKMNGVETSRIIRQDEGSKDTHIFFLISDKADYSAISELRSTADDCFLKPVNLPFLVHRIEELFHPEEVEHNGLSQVKQNGHHNGNGNGLLIDRETYMVHFMGNEFSFPKKEFELLHLLASVPEKVFTRKDIFKTVWNKEIDTRSARTIDVHIRKLREKLEGINIVTVKGVGYKLSVK